MKKRLYDIGWVVLVEIIFGHLVFILTILFMQLPRILVMQLPYSRLMNFLCFFVLLLILPLVCFVVLKKIISDPFVFKVLYIPIKVVVFIGIMIYIGVFLKPLIDDKLIPFYTNEQHQEKVALLKKQEKDYKSYINNQKNYTVLHSFPLHTTDGTFTLVSHNDKSELGWGYDGYNEEFFTPIYETNKRNIILSPETETYQMVDSTIGVINLLIHEDAAYISIPSNKQLYPLAGDQKVVVDDLLQPVRSFIRFYITDYLDSYTLTLKGGIIHRTGKKNDDIHWVFNEGGATHTLQNDRNAMSVDPAILPSYLSRAEVHIEAFIDGEYRQASNTLKLTEKAD